MSEDTNVGTVTTLKDCGNGVTVVVDEFGDKSEGKGLKFAVPQFASGAAADAIYGTEETAAIINAAIRTKVATKVKTNKFPRNVDDETAVKSFQRMAEAVVDGVKGLIFSVEEALSYRPGERVPGTKKLIQAKIDEITSKLRNNKLTQEEAFAAFQQIAELQARCATAAE